MIGRRWRMLGAVLVLAGCASDPPARLYVLRPIADDKPRGQAPAGPLLDLQPVVLPDYLDTTEILVRVGPNEIRASETGRWGERLSHGVDQALAAALAVRLPGDRVTLDSSDRSATRLRVVVHAFDVQPDGRNVLTASWTFLSPRGDAPARASSGALATPAVTGPVDDAAIVGAMSRTIGLLADRIAIDATTIPPS